MKYNKNLKKIPKYEDHVRRRKLGLSVWFQFKARHLASLSLALPLRVVKMDIWGTVQPVQTWIKQLIIIVYLTSTYRYHNIV